MKILITGTNVTQAKPTVNSQLQLINGIYAIRDALVQLGHEVDQRPVTPGEDFDQYDKVILYLAPVGGFASVFTFGAMWAYYNTPKEKVILALDDWQSSAIQYAIKRWGIAIDANFHRDMYDQALAWVPLRDQLLEAVYDISVKDWEVPVMAPTFYGEGDIRDLNVPAVGKQFCFDPSGYFKGVYKTQPAEDQMLRWVYCSLCDRSKWLNKQKLTWPVELFGNRKHKQRRIKEVELINDWYATSSGVLCPPTGHKTGLWWRSRYQFAIEAGAVLAGEPHETSFCGDGYDVIPQYLEAFDEVAYNDVRDQQAHTYTARTWDKEKLVNKLGEFITSI